MTLELALQPRSETAVCVGKVQSPRDRIIHDCQKDYESSSFKLKTLWIGFICLRVGISGGPL